MLRADVPTRFNIPFAGSAIAPYVHEVPEASQISVTGGAASLTDGFPPLCFSPVSAGGVPPWGNDMNGILKQITQWIRWQTAGGLAAPYDATFSTAIGGYPLGAVIPSATIPGSFWISSVDGNTTDPDAAGVGWSAYGFGTADAKPTLKTVADYGWLIANDGTIGNGSSNSTTLADSILAWPLFSTLWTNISNTYATLYTSAAAPVARGASAAADFAANRQIGLTKVLGRALIIAGAGSGLTNRVLGQILGEENHLLVSTEIPASGYTFTGTQQTWTANQAKLDFINNAQQVPSSGSSNLLAGNVGSTNGAPTTTITPAGSVTVSGGGNSHNNMQPSSAWNVMVKL